MSSIVCHSITFCSNFGSESIIRVPFNHIACSLVYLPQEHKGFQGLLGYLNPLRWYWYQNFIYFWCLEFLRIDLLKSFYDFNQMSKRVNGEEARSLSLVDAIASADKLLAVARQWALDIYERRKPWIISLYKTEKLEPLREARAILKSARLRVQRESPNLNHPLVCIDVIEMGIVSDPRNALWKVN